jgi:GNAT superfamily N-acetyltransferase
MITYRHEPASELLRFFSECKALALASDTKDAQAMFGDHWEEIASKKHILVLDLDYEAYVKLIQAGCLEVVTARDDDKLVGYITIILSKHLHYKTVIVAKEDVHFVHRKYRGRMIGDGMLKEAERVVEKRGAKLMFVHTKPHSDHGALLEKIGYSRFEIIYAKEIGG